MYRIEKVNKSDLSMFEIFARWDADPKIKPFIMPRMTPEPLDDMTPEMLMASAQKNSNKELYVLLVDDIPVGTTSLDRDFFMLASSYGKTAWISIVIGEKKYWGKGYSQLMMTHLEQVARDQGFEYIELGVFEFNHRAIHMYRKMGYEVFKVIEDFTYHEGYWYNDIRMLKKIDKL